MHSNRMCTARSLTASRSIRWGGVGCHVWQGGSVHTGEDACVPGVGVHACRGACHTRPLVNRMTDACENITLPQTSFAGDNKIQEM